MLALLGTVGLAGCLGAPRPATPSTAATVTQAPAPESFDGDSIPAGPVRCRGEPTAAERSVDDHPGYGDDMRYFPGNGTVRLVTARSNSGPRGFADRTFEDWATFEAAEAARPRAVSTTADRLGTDGFGSGVGRPPEDAATDDVVVRLHLTTRVDDGTVVATTAVSLSALVAAAPRSVETTVTLEGDAFTRSVPVFADHTRVSFGGD